MPLSEAISITQQICSAVAYAHKNGVVHRDIKPSNVIISTQGEGVDHRTDIYAIGAMLFEMVSGNPPFETDSVVPRMRKHINEPVPDLRQRVPTLPPRMIEIIVKSLAKDPAKRFQSLKRSTQI